MGLPDFTIEVALQVPFRHSFTYEVPESSRLQIQFGSRVIVPFRKRRVVGVVTALHGKAADQADFEIKPIVGMSMRALIGMVQAFAMPGNCSA